MTDPYLWLEERNGEKATEWAKAESAVAKAHFEKDPRFAQSKNEILSILASDEKIPMVSLFEGYAYNLWQDEIHKRGIWRRAPLAEYKKPNPKWEVLLDLDDLADKEKTPWVYAGASRLAGSERVLLHLSRNSQDATEVREFSLATKEFIKDGFFFPESKSRLIWYSENQLLVAPALNEDQQTTSGYPRKVYLWTRGEDFSKARLLYEAKKDIVSAWPGSYMDQGKKIFTIGYYVNYDFMVTFLLDENLKLNQLPVPPDVLLEGIFNSHFLVSPRGEWKGFPAGSLLAIPMSAMGLTEVPVDQIKSLFQPTARSAFDGSLATKNRLYLMINENVRGQVYEARLGPDGAWTLHKVFHSESSFYLSTADEHSDAMIFSEEGYLQPRRLLLSEGLAPAEIKKTKSYFNEAPYITEQKWVKSKDGVEIPYTVVRAKGLKYDGTNPTLLYGYGGFALPGTPAYSAVMGKEWLEKGGVYVRANIRGGGEFGPNWHKAAMLENKQKSYDDFIAVAEDLIAQKITSPKHLGIQGGSNGGLLVGAVTMQRPELFNAVVCQIPLLDMLRYTKLPPGASWVGEYGDPDDPKFREIISKYSPYQNISKDKTYPKMYFQTTQADDRVHPGHARKMTARMKEYSHQVLFFESSDGGHGGGGVKLEDQAGTMAYLYVYLYQQLGHL